MSSLIDQYLEKLEKRLAKRLTNMVAHEQSAEIRLHLHASVAEKMASGEPELEATRKALEALGSDRSIADGIIRSRLGIDKKNPWRISWLAGLLAILYGFIPETFFEFNVIPEWLMSVTLWLPTLFLVVFGIVCWKSRRILWMPMLTVCVVVGLIGVVQITAFSPAGFTSHSMSSLQKLVGEFQAEKSKLEFEVSFSKAPATTFPYPQSLKQDQQYWAPQKDLASSSHNFPGTAIQVEDGRSIRVWLGLTDTEAKARKLWMTLGQEYAQANLTRIKEINDSLAMWGSPASRREMIVTGLNFLFRSTLKSFLLIMAFNLVVVILERLSRIGQDRLWHRNIQRSA